MDVFRLNNPSSVSGPVNGEIINNIKSKTWIERYNSAGEFTFIAAPETGIIERLPIGSFVSHINTKQVMMVEDHEIKEQKGRETEVKLTGRSIEAPLFEIRVLGANKPTSDNTPAEYILASDNTWDQAVQLLRHHSYLSLQSQPGNALPNLIVLTNVSTSGVTVERVLSKGTVYSKLLEILAVEDLGIKSIRPHLNWANWAGEDDLTLEIHKGVDRSIDVVFSYTSGDLVSADYFGSNRKHRNYAYIYGRWVDAFVTTTNNYYDRRQLLVDASDIDGHLTANPTGTARVRIRDLMRERGASALGMNKMITITSADLGENDLRFQYRSDYDIGDRVTVRGNYNTTAIMRVAEYVETEDETGAKAYPTLSLYP